MPAPAAAPQVHLGSGAPQREGAGLHQGQGEAEQRVDSVGPHSVFIKLQSSLF